MNTLAKRIKYYRNKKALTQEFVATELGMKASNYAKYESGERTPKDERLLLLAQIIGVPYDFLYTGAERAFLDLLNVHIQSAVLGDFDSFCAFRSDVLEDEAYTVISDCFEAWYNIIKEQAYGFYEDYLDNPTLKSTVVLHRLYKEYSHGRLQGMDSVLELSLPDEMELDDATALKLAFCIAASKYLTDNDPDAILDEAEGFMGKIDDIDSLVYFAVTVFVPFLSYIGDAVEFTMNTNLDDFENAFLYGALTPPDETEDEPDDLD